MLINMLPAPAAAAGEGTGVLTSIGHDDAVECRLEGQTITIYVPSFLWRRNRPDQPPLYIRRINYEFVIVRPEAPKQQWAAPPAVLTVFYKIKAATAALSRITSSWRSPEPAKFSGVISKRARPTPPSFTAGDFAANYRQNDGPPWENDKNYIIIKGSNNLNVGVLKYNNADYAFGEQIPTKNLSSLRFAPVPGGTGTVSYEVEAYYKQDDNNAASLGTAILTVTVTPPVIALSSYTASSGVKKGDTWQVSASHFGYTPVALSLTYIKITEIPQTADGYLCLSTDLAAGSGYPAIQANKALTAGAVIPFDHVIPAAGYEKHQSSNSVSLSGRRRRTQTSADWADRVLHRQVRRSGTVVLYLHERPVDLNSSISAPGSTAPRGAPCPTWRFLPPKTSGTLYYNYDFVSKKARRSLPPRSITPGPAPTCPVSRRRALPELSA